MLRTPKVGLSQKAALALMPLALLAACGSDKDARKPTDEVFPVQVITVQPENLMRTINAVGTVRYRREVPLGFTTAGKVATVRFEEGDFIKKGALLAALDSTSVGADLSAAQAERARANSELQRIKSLYDQGWITKARFEQAQATAQAANARVAQAGFASGTAQLYAPSSGVVLSRLVQPGQVVGAGTAALVIGQADQGFVFRAPIIDRDASKLHVGMPALITIESLGPDPLQGNISEIDGRANEATGAFTVQFTLAPSAKLKSGQIGSAAINMPASGGGALQIPASAIFGIRTGEGLVYVVDTKTNRVETRSVTIERLADAYVIISGGLKTGDVIVVSGAEKLRTGSKVRMVKAAG